MVHYNVSAWYGERGLVGDLDEAGVRVRTVVAQVVVAARHLKGSGSFFKTITKVLDGISGITKNIIFFQFEGL